MSNVLQYIQDTKNEIHYCEACISPNGDVFNAVPSHLYFLINHVSETKEELYDIMPEYASPVYWIVEHSGWVALWYEFGLSDEMSDEQIESLRMLQKSGRISNPYWVSIPKEKSICGLRDNPTELEKVIKKRRTLVFVDGSFLASIEGYEI